MGWAAASRLSYYRLPPRTGGCPGCESKFFPPVRYRPPSSFSNCVLTGWAGGHAGEVDMKSANLKLTYIGGPTALLEINGLRLLTHPTFDPAGEEYVTGVYTLRKRIGPAVSASSLDPVDVILLSHDHHFDNLDREGRRFLPNAGRS